MKNIHRINGKIYITNDEEIKDIRPHKGKWHLEKGLILNKFPNYLTDLSECKLVIMTKDPDLIKDGVQTIDDKFLEWFVKNPSFEWVETYPLGLKNEETGESFHYKYEIIIPKEEPKQETLEEVAERLYPIFMELGNSTVEHDGNEEVREAFIDGAKWQQQQNKNFYSDEEVLQLLNDYDKHIQENFDMSKTILSTEQWFNQNKKQ